MSNECLELVFPLYLKGNISHDTYYKLYDFCHIASESQTQEKYGEPMLWIGIYIAVASLLCVLAMAADLLHGFLNNKLWFPCKYFTINAASLMVITVAMKLPVDLNNSMPGVGDQIAKSGSMAFMCIMMVNLMPSLATMNNKELLSNFIALAILIITVAVNFCIEIKTGVVETDIYSYENATPTICVVVMLTLLVILMSSTLAIPTSKWILDSKYRELHKMASNEQQSQLHAGMSAVEKITSRVGRYWVMAGTGSPQFVMATSPTCSASGVICVLIAFIYSITMIDILDSFAFQCKSDYKWSTEVIFIIQAIGVVVGSIAPLFRCFAALSFKLSIEWSKNHIKVYRVESYWTQKLSDWKWRQTHLPLPIRSRKFKHLVLRLKNLFLSCCTGLQKVIVVACKTIGLIPIFSVVFAFYGNLGFKFLKAMFFREPISANSFMTLEPQQDPKREDLSRYVLQLHDEVELADRTLKSVTKSLDRVIKKAEKQKPNKLLELLEGPSGSEGSVQQLDRNSVLPLLSEEPPNCWSLPVITLTSIVIAIPNIEKKRVDSLLSIVDEGLKYVYLVEETLDDTNDHVKFQKVAKKLWLEVQQHTWLKNHLQGEACKRKTSEGTLQWLMDKAEEKMVESEKSKVGQMEMSLDISIPARSMYNTTKRILLSYQGMNGQFSEEQLFEKLSAMIAHVFGACFTNLPRVIAMKCYASAIEKREESVKAAAQLLGQTKEIINKLQEHELLGLDPDQNNIC